MKTTVTITLGRTEIDNLFKDLAERTAAKMLANPENYNCNIQVDANTKEFSGVEIIFSKET